MTNDLHRAGSSPSQAAATAAQGTLQTVTFSLALAEVKSGDETKAQAVEVRCLQELNDSFLQAG